VASLELRNQTYRVVFMYGGRKMGFSLDTGDKQTADALRGGVEKTLMLLGQGALIIPEGGDIIAFVRSGGKTAEPPRPAAPAEVTFAEFKEKYLDTHRHGAMEQNSLQTVTMHLGHFAKTLGDRFPVRTLTLADLQRHVSERAKKKYRGKPLSPVTLRKEMASLRAAWNWAALSGIVQGQFPSKGLVYPKTDEKPPFMTLTEIRRRITPAMTEAERSELWECLYLTQPESDALLVILKERSAHSWIYPLVCFIAHTGARRSEALRALVSDVDFEHKTVLIREKKRSRKQRTTRRVPLTPFLTGVLKAWLAEHPGGSALFCQAGEVFRSKKRSKTTGHQDEKVRPSSLKGRMATVRKREAPPVVVITRDEAHDHFKRTLTGTKWEVVKGFHVLRHGFISACASKGVDQRLIDEWVGHQSDEQRKRYRHLYPSVQQQAIASVFGGE
jgi:integrase